MNSNRESRVATQPSRGIMAGISSRVCSGVVQLIALGTLLLAVPSSWAAEFSSTKYDVYKGDANGDGHEDIYLKRKPDIILIASQPIIPLALQVDESFLMSGGADGFFGAPVLNNSVNVAGLSKQSAGVSFADFNNDGIDDIIIQGEVLNEQSVLLTGTSAGTTPALLQQFTEIHGQQVDLTNASIELEDVNGDGYADFVVTWIVGAQALT